MGRGYLLPIFSFRHHRHHAVDAVDGPSWSRSPPAWTTERRPWTDRGVERMPRWTVGGPARRSPSAPPRTVGSIHGRPPGPERRSGGSVHNRGALSTDSPRLSTSRGQLNRFRRCLGRRFSSTIPERGRARFSSRPRHERPSDLRAVRAGRAVQRRARRPCHGRARRPRTARRDPPARSLTSSPANSTRRSCRRGQAAGMRADAVCAPRPRQRRERVRRPRCRAGPSWRRSAPTPDPTVRAWAAARQPVSPRRSARGPPRSPGAARR